MELPILNTQTTLGLKAAVFEQPFRQALIHQVVRAYLAKGRRGTRAQKTRSEVAGSGKKPWRQKGTGRARAGSVSSPLWRSGGIIFAAKPRSFEQKVNRKMYRGALQSIFAQLIRTQRLSCVEAFSLEAPKTRLLALQLSNIGVNRALLVTCSYDKTLHLAARNLPLVKVIETEQLNPVDLIRYPKTLITVDAMKKVEELLS